MISCKVLPDNEMTYFQSVWLHFQVTLDVYAKWISLHSWCHYAVMTLNHGTNKGQGIAMYDTDPVYSSTSGTKSVKSFENTDIKAPFPLKQPWRLWLKFNCTLPQSTTAKHDHMHIHYGVMYRVPYLNLKCVFCTVHSRYLVTFFQIT